MSLALAARPRTARLHGPIPQFIALIGPAVILAAFCYFLPLAHVLWTSVTEPHPGLENYALLATSPSIHKVLTTTLRICVITTAVTVVLSYLVAYTLIHSGPVAQRLMLAGILLPLWVSVLVRAFAWIALLRREGLVNNALLASGLISHPLPMLWNEFGVSVGIIHYMLPYGILPLAAQMRSIDPVLPRAARSLGAGRTEAFLRVFLPLSLPGIVGATVLVFIFSLGFYVTPTLLGGGRIIMIAEYIAVQIQQILQWGIGTMLAVTLVLLILALLALLSRLVNLRTLFGA